MKRMVRVLTALTIAALAGATLAAPAAAALPDPTPRAIRIAPAGEDSDWVSASVTASKRPGLSPAGANDWSCRPSAAHPEPVVLIHGTLENMYSSWNGLGPILADQGYCVFALDYGSTGVGGMKATGEMVASAREISDFVDRVRTATGAAAVSLIGHSQGGVQARYVANLLQPRGAVARVIMLAGSNHAITVGGLAELAKLVLPHGSAAQLLELMGMPAIVEQVRGDGAFYQDVNGAGETVPGIAYTAVATVFDEVVTPFRQAFITGGPGATVENTVVQRVCPEDLSEHLSLPYSKNVAQIVLNALDPDDPHAVRCYIQHPVIGSTGW